MSKKQKKDKKDKKDRKSLQHLSIEQLLDQARNFLENGKAREAIDILKVAEKKFGASDPLRLLLFRSYRMRERQLRSKGMIQEANVVRKNLTAVLPPVKLLSESDVIGYLSHASLEEAVRFYQSLRKDDPLCGLVERQLAYRLMASDDWHPLEHLPPDHPLRQDAGIVRTAVDSMNEGNWETALQELKPVSRRSPYAPLRLFCKAMTLFLAENDDELLQVVARMPSDFPLNPILVDIRNRLQGTTPPKTQAPAARPLSPSAALWENQARAEQILEEMLRILDRDQLRSLSISVANFARTIYPADPTFAILYILETLWAEKAIDSGDIHDMRPLLTAAVPGSDLDILEAKIHLEEDPRLQAAIESYCKLLERTIPDPIRCKRLQAMVCMFGARKLQEEIELLDQYGRKALFFIVPNRGFTMEEMHQHMTQLILQSIELDPYHRNAYSFLLETCKTAKANKDILEKALLTMADTFPDDPYPCLELSNLYYRKNAFRKAEKILDEAVRRAPHDRRVIERRALSFVIAACKNFNRSNADLVFRDLEKAETFGSRELAPLIVAKRMLFHLLNKPDRLKDLTLEDIPEKLSLVDRLRVLGLLYQEAGERTDLFKKKHVQKVQKCLKHAIEKADLDPDAIVNLLSPFPSVYQPVLPEQPIAHALLCAHKNIWQGFSNEKLIDTFLFLFHPDIIGFLIGELEQRLRKNDNPQSLQMRFFLLTLNYMDPMPSFRILKDRYQDILREVSDTDRRELQHLARRLGAHAKGLLKQCLMNFNFEPLERPISSLFDFQHHESLFDDDDDDDDLEEEDFLDEFKDEEYEELKKIGELLNELRPLFKEHADQMSEKDRDELKQTCECFVDELDLNGKSHHVILSARRRLQENDNTRPILESLAHLVQVAEITDLSREAKILLFGSESNAAQLKFPF